MMSQLMTSQLMTSRLMMSQPGWPGALYLRSVNHFKNDPSIKRCQIKLMYLFRRDKYDNLFPKYKQTPNNGNCKEILLEKSTL